MSCRNDPITPGFLETSTAHNWRSNVSAFIAYLTVHALKICPILTSLTAVTWRSSTHRTRDRNYEVLVNSYDIMQFLRRRRLVWNNVDFQQETRVVTVFINNFADRYIVKVPSRSIEVFHSAQSLRHSSVSRQQLANLMKDGVSGALQEPSITGHFKGQRWTPSWTNVSGNDSWECARRFIVVRIVINLQ